jgi:PPM family protein phosphatase
VLQEAALAAILTVPSLRLATTNLVQAALDGGSRDNVTVVVADVVDVPPVAGNGLVLGAALDLANLVDPAAVRRLRSA